MGVQGKLEKSGFNMGELNLQSVRTTRCRVQEKLGREKGAFHWSDRSKPDVGRGNGHQYRTGSVDRSRST